MKYKNKHTSEFDKKIQISDCMFNIYNLFTISLEWNSIEYHTIKNMRKTKSLSFKGLILFLLFIFICLVLESILSEGIEVLLSSLIFSSFQIVFFASDVLSLSLTYTYKEAQGREMSVWCVCKLPSSPSAQYWPMTVWCEHSDVITHHAVDQSCMTWIGKKEREEEKKKKSFSGSQAGTDSRCSLQRVSSGSRFIHTWHFTTGQEIYIFLGLYE